MNQATAETVSFEVDGMTCASCALRIERVLRKQEGVNNAIVNYAGHQATAEIGTGVEVAALEAAVQRIGYAITEIRDGEHRTNVTERYAEEVRGQRRRFVGAASLTVPIVLLAQFGPDALWAGVVEALLTAIVVFGFGAQFHKAAIKQVMGLSPAMDTLVSIGTVSAWGFSIYAVAAEDALFFETAAIIVTLILLGRFFEARAKGRASKAITKLLDIGAKQARVRRLSVEKVVPTNELEVGDVVIVLPGEKIATDGVVVAGESKIDESMLTGESALAGKSVGDDVFGATINQQGRLEFKATRVGRETVLSQIVRLVEDAQATKAPVQKLADRVSSVFVPVVIVVALGVFGTWLAVNGRVDQAITNAVAVLIIACPCAMGLATPTAIMVGSGRGAEMGTLFKNAEVFERAKAVDTVVFDKTGTLTRGAMTLTEVLTSEDADRLLFLAGSIEAASEHPIGKAVALGAEEREVTLTIPTDFEALGGQGVIGTVDGMQVVVGKPTLLIERGLRVPDSHHAFVDRIERAGHTAILVGWDAESRGALGVADTLRYTSAAAVAALHDQGVEVTMLTGDNRRTAEMIASEVGIDRVIAEVMPADKAWEIKRLQDDGKSVGFVGDGINDAPALTRADLGMAVGSGTDVAIEAGDVVLMNGDPMLAVASLGLARATFRTIIQNLFWAFGYNTAAIPLAALGLLNPMFAAGAMALSSVSVVTNSLRLRRFSLSMRAAGSSSASATQVG